MNENMICAGCGIEMDALEDGLCGWCACDKRNARRRGEKAPLADRTAFDSSAWLGELGAALRREVERREKARNAGDLNGFHDAVCDIKALSQLLERERGRSPSIVLDRHPKKTESQGAVAEQHVNDE